MSGPGLKFTACGCRHCLDELTRQFCAIVHSQFSVADEKNAELAATRGRVDAALNQTVVNRIAEYSGPMPDCTA